MNLRNAPRPKEFVATNSAIWGFETSIRPHPARLTWRQMQYAALLQASGGQLRARFCRRRAGI